MSTSLAMDGSGKSDRSGRSELIARHEIGASKKAVRYLPISIGLLRSVGDD